MNTVSIILAISSPVVALAAVASAAWQNKRTLQHDREMRDLEYQRSLMDDASQVLEDGELASLTLLHAVVAEGGRLTTFDEPLQLAAKASRAMKFMHARLILRRKADDEIVTSFKEAMGALSRSMVLATADLAEREASSLRNELDAGHRRFVDATKRFIEACASIVGAK